MADKYSIHQFCQDEWRELKSIRLEALQNAHGKFGASYENEVLLEDEKWQSRLMKDDVAYFALAYNHEIIGMTGVYLPDLETAKFIASYIKPDHRNQGLSGLLYQARIDWAKSKNVSRVVVAHRKSNVASMYANQKFDFIYTHDEDVVWPDGTREVNVCYELKL